MMKKITTVLFDADNTLLDFLKDEHQALARALETLGVPATDENISIYSRINQGLWKQLEKGEITKPELKRVRFRLFFDAIGFSCDKDPLEVNEFYLSLLSEGGNLLEGAIETVRKLRSDGLDLYIVTNGIAATQARRLERSGLTPYISEVFVSETIGYQKPRKEYFDFVLDKIPEKDKEKILLVGDSLTSDIKGAMNADIPCCWLNLADEELPDGYKPDFIISKVSETLNIISCRNGDAL
ncbi:MAG: YjjG family noncanonical pyrimidine nucleotidase [Clostridia bacterium]|nr:YjjG family noncanonical pyrimidine nucleotidase [Clostridia bacterium]